MGGCPVITVTNEDDGEAPQSTALALNFERGHARPAPATGAVLAGAIRDEYPWNQGLKLTTSQPPTEPEQES